MSAATRTGTEQPMGHRDWMAAAEEKYRRLGTLLDQLTDEEWRRSTDCAEWDVHDVVAHLVGAAESTARVREMLRQQRVGRGCGPASRTSTA